MSRASRLADRSRKIRLTVSDLVKPLLPVKARPMVLSALLYALYVLFDVPLPACDDASSSRMATGMRSR